MDEIKRECDNAIDGDLRRTFGRKILKSGRDAGVNA